MPAIGLDQLHGHGFLTLLAGRAPAGPGEIALGPRTLRALGLHVGQRVEVSAGRPDVRHAHRGDGGPRVVRRRRRQRDRPGDRRRRSPPRCSPSRARAAARGKPATTSSSSGTGPAPTCGRSGPAEGGGHPAGCPPGLRLVTADQRPSDIQNYAGVRDTPLVLGAVLALLAIGALTHVLLTGVQRRRRDLAVLADPGPAPVAAAPGGVLGGEHAGRGGPPGGAAAGPAGRPLGVGSCSPSRSA